MRSVRLTLAALTALCAVAILGAPAAHGLAYDNGPAGTNDWACTPSAAHPQPVVLVHGLGATGQANWGYIAPRLNAAGYCTFAQTYGLDPRVKAFGAPGGTIRMQESAEELRAFVRRVRAATGAKRVDIVGHSEGTVMPRYYLERLGGAKRVDDFVALTPLWRGTTLGGVHILRDAGSAFGVSNLLIDLVSQFCSSCPQFLQGSAYLDDLNADGEAIPGVDHTNIVTRYDELVIPYTSGVMRDGGENLIVQKVCPSDLSEHASVAVDPVVVQMILNALDPKHATPVEC